ncbi:ABC transporter substrate-binding protein [Martelella sp. HB161492]|uniref:ABC transporter substrate-binding protein n=1 Tax=Martelella sp. HB161492 TaxID=2720726 RepID=UPI0015902B29|nr:ABC transporter substrate-binding protein [Martelella sp. HB161492]
MKANRALFYTCSLLAATVLTVHSAAARDKTVIGVVAPQSGPYAILGQQIEDGARLAAAETGVKLAFVDEPCDNSGTDVSPALKKAGADIAIGFLCSETLDAALPGLSKDKTPAITVSVRSMPLMEDAAKNGWPLFRLAPGEQEQPAVTAQLILDRWAGKPVALLDDGTISYRESVNTIRNTLESAGLKPVLVDTFRPAQEQQRSLVRRLAQAGATNIYIGGDRNDIAIIARDASEAGVGLTIMGGDSMRAQNEPVALENGVQALALPVYAQLAPAKAIVAAADKAKVIPEGYVIPAAAAVEVAAEAADTAEDKALIAALEKGTFKTAMGNVVFGQDGDLNRNSFMLQQWQDDHFVPVANGSNQQ